MWVKSTLGCYNPKDFGSFLKMPRAGDRGAGGGSWGRGARPSQVGVWCRWESRCLCCRQSPGGCGPGCSPERGDAAVAPRASAQNHQTPAEPWRRGWHARCRPVPLGAIAQPVPERPEGSSCRHVSLPSAAAPFSSVSCFRKLLKGCWRWLSYS